MIREKAHFFATTCGNPEGSQKILTTAWLEKFKQKNNLVVTKSRKSSTDATSDKDSPAHLNTNSNAASNTQTPNGVSPVSPGGVTSPSPMSPTQSQESLKKEASDGVTDCATEYQHAHSQSTTSLDTAPSLSASVTSPTSPFLSSDSPFTPTVRSRVPSISSNSSRPRSQTFPITNVDPGLISTNESSDQLTPKNMLQQSLSISMLDSPLEEEPETTVSANDSNVIKRNRSNPEINTQSMQPPPLPKSNTISPVSTPSSPTQDEARRALELVMNYFQNQPSGLAAQDFITIGKLMEKLELAQNQGGTLPGGLHRIDENVDGPRVSKKRSIHTLS